MGVHEALLDACPVRLQYILMTSLATIAAAMRQRVARTGLGPRSMGIVVIGGVFYPRSSALRGPLRLQPDDRLESAPHEGAKERCCPWAKMKKI